MASITASATTGVLGAARRQGRGTLLAIVLLAVAILAAIVNIVAGLHASTLIAQETAVVTRVGNVLSALKDLETGERGFLLTGEDRYLEPYDLAEKSLMDLLGEMPVTDDGPLAALRRQVAVKQDIAARAIRSRRAGGLDEAIASVRSGDDKAAMDAVRVRVAEISRELEARIAAGQHDDALRNRVLIAVSLFAALLACGYFAWLAVTRRRQEQATASLLEGVLDNAPVGLGFLDHELRVRRANRALAAMSERALGAILDREIWDVLPDLRGPLEDRLRSVVNGGRMIANVEASAALAANPGLLRHFQLSFYPMRQTHRAPGSDGAGVVITDVTTRTRVERRLKQSEERFRSLIEATASIVWATPPSGSSSRRSPAGPSLPGKRRGAAGLGLAGCRRAGRPACDDRCLESAVEHARTIAWSAACAGGRQLAPHGGAGRAVRDEEVRSANGSAPTPTSRTPLAEEALAAAKGGGGGGRTGPRACSWPI